jgi:hypothetical protein
VCSRRPRARLGRRTQTPWLLTAGIYASSYKLSGSRRRRRRTEPNRTKVGSSDGDGRCTIRTLSGKPRGCACPDTTVAKNLLDRIRSGPELGTDTLPRRRKGKGKWTTGMSTRKSRGEARPDRTRAFARACIMILQQSAYGENCCSFSDRGGDAASTCSKRTGAHARPDPDPIRTAVRAHCMMLLPRGDTPAAILRTRIPPEAVTNVHRRTDEERTRGRWAQRRAPFPPNDAAAVASSRRRRRVQKMAV